MKKFFVTIMVALFATVVLGQTKTEIKPLELPKCIADWVKQNLKGFTIDKAYKFEKKIDNKIVIYYYARAVKEKEKQWYSFDKDCLAKKISEAEAQTDPPRQLPPVKSSDKEKPKVNEKK
jgi:hypothetical protein